MLDLTGTNTYSGGTSVNSGVLEAATTAALPKYNVAGDVSVAGGATLAVNVGGTGQWNSGASNDLGNLIAANSGNFSAGAMLGIDTSGGSFTFPGALAGAMGVNKLGGNTLYLTGTNSYSGPTTISGGTLQLASADAALNSTVSVKSPSSLAFASGVGTFSVGGLAGTSSFALAAAGGSPVTLQVGGNNAATTYAGVLSGAGGLTKTGSGNLFLNNFNSFTGLTTITAGTLTAAQADNSNINNWGTFNAAGAGITIEPNGTLVAAQVGAIFGHWWNGSPIGNGISWATITNSGMMIDTAGANVNLGPLTLSGGTVAAIGTGDQWGTWNINNNVAVTQSSLISAAAFDLGGNQGAGQRTFTVSPGATLNVTGYFRNGGSGQGTVYGIILNGGGTIVLSGSNTYTGVTSVANGTLLLGPGGSLGGTLVSVATGGTFGAALNSGGVTSILGGPLQLNSGSTLDLAGDGSTNTLQATAGTLAGANLKFDLSNSACDELLFTGAAAVSGSNTIGVTGLGSMLTSGGYTLISAASGLVSGDFTLSASTINVGVTTYSLSLVHSTTAAEILTVTPLATSLGFWTASSGSWSIGANWAGSVAPNAASAGAVLNASTTAAVTVTLDEPVTLGTLQFGNSSAVNTAAYTLSGSGAKLLTLTNSGSGATISVNGGSQVISAPLTLADSLTVTPSAGASLSISGAIGQSGTRSLTLAGPGTLILSGTNNYTGGTSVEAGTLDVTSNTALADGTSLAVGAGGTFIFDPTVVGSALDLSSPQVHSTAQVERSSGTGNDRAVGCGGNRCRGGITPA